MEAVRLPDAAAFLEHAGAFLLEREAEHNLMLGIAARLRGAPNLYGSEDPYFAVVEDGRRVVGAAMQTPPHNLILSELEPASLPALVAGARAARGTLPGVVGPKAAAAEFARLWGGPATVAMEERIYRAERTVAPAGVRGRMRPYAEDDFELAVAWHRAFIDEAVPDHPVENDARELVERRLGDADGGFELWEDGRRVVSLAGYGSPTPNGIRIGPVYTPPELRRRGYASALTAAVTQKLLDAGRRFCFLLTDLANPTSNSIYRQVGYEPVADVDQWSFGRRG